MGTGWKGKLGAILTMASGLIGLVLHFVAPESSVAMDPTTAIAVIVAGFSLFGIRDKLGA